MNVKKQDQYFAKYPTRTGNTGNVRDMNVMGMNGRRVKTTITETETKTAKGDGVTSKYRRIVSVKQEQVVGNSPGLVTGLVTGGVAAGACVVLLGTLVPVAKLSNAGMWAVGCAVFGGCSGLGRVMYNEIQRFLKHIAKDTGLVDSNNEKIKDSDGGRNDRDSESEEEIDRDNYLAGWPAADQQQCSLSSGDSPPKEEKSRRVTRSQTSKNKRLSKS